MRSNIKLKRKVWGKLKNWKPTIHFTSHFLLLSCILRWQLITWLVLLAVSLSVMWCWRFQKFPTGCFALPSSLTCSVFSASQAHSSHCRSALTVQFAEPHTPIYPHYNGQNPKTRNCQSVKATPILISLTSCNFVSLQHCQDDWQAKCQPTC